MHIEPIWAGDTVAILASGPSLRANDVLRLRNRCRVMAIKDAAQLAPWCDAMYGGDYDWWRRNDYGKAFHVERIAVSIRNPDWEREARRSGIRVVRGVNGSGLSHDPAFIHLGYHSGFQALNLAYLMGASRILLLGYDYCVPSDRTHFFGNRPAAIAKASPYALFRHAFDGCREELSERGVQVINCSRNSTLDAFERDTLEHALCR